MTVEQLETKLARRPQSPLFARLAELYLSDGRTAEAKELCRSGLEQYPSYLTAYLVLAQCYANERDYRTALSALGRARGIAPHSEAIDDLQKEWEKHLSGETASAPPAAAAEAVEEPPPAGEVTAPAEEDFAPLDELPPLDIVVEKPSSAAPEESGLAPTGPEPFEEALQPEAPPTEEQGPGMAEAPAIPETGEPPSAGEMPEPGAVASEEPAVTEAEEHQPEPSAPPEAEERQETPEIVTEAPAPEGLTVESQAVPAAEPPSGPMAPEPPVETPAPPISGQSVPEAGPVEDDGRIVSATLAEIYARQGAFNEAILTYRLLKRTRPERAEECDRRIRELEEKLPPKAPNGSGKPPSGK